MNGFPDSEWKKFAKFDQDPFEVKSCFYNEKKLPSTAEFEHFKKNKIEFGMKINIQILKGGETFTMPTSSMDTIKTIKKAIYEKSEIPVERQRLLFLGKPLEDDRTLSDYQIRSDATLVMEQKQIAEDFSFLELLEIRDGAKGFQDQYGFEICVKVPNGFTLNLKVKSSDTIKDIKKEVMNYKGIRVERQKIKFAGQELKDDRSLSEYNIPKRALLYVVDRGPIGIRNVPQMEKIEDWLRFVSVLYQEKIFVLNVRCTTRLRDFKKALAEITDCPFGEIMFMYGGRILIGEEIALSSFQVENETTQIIIPRSNAGDCLRFIQMLRNTLITEITEDVWSFQESLNSLNKNQILDGKTPNVLNILQNLQKINANLYDENGILAIMLWVSNILNNQLNQALADGDFSQWNVYLKHLLNGIKAMPSLKGRVYRGPNDFSGLKDYKKGETVIWKIISGSSEKKNYCEVFCKSQWHYL